MQLPPTSRNNAGKSADFPALHFTGWGSLQQPALNLVKTFSERAASAELNFQISKSKIYAPTNGVILYASTVQIARRRYWIRPLAVGETAVQRQELIYIPLDAGMIVELMVPEASLNKLETGMPANVRVDAFPDRIFHGRLTKIGILPDGQDSLTGGAIMMTSPFSTPLTRWIMRLLSRPTSTGRATHSRPSCT